MRPLLADLFRFRPAPQTGTAIAQRAAIRATVAMVLTAAALIPYGLMPTFTVAPTGPNEGAVMADRDHAPGSPAAVLAEHDADCWRAGDRPLADLPGSALIQRPDGRTVRTRDRVAVDDAFKEALGMPNRDTHTTVALCL